MTAAYKIALAAGASLLLIVIASLILRGENNTPAPEDTGEELALNDTIAPIAEPPAVDPVPPADAPGLGLGVDLTPVGPPVRDETLTTDTPPSPEPEPESPTRLSYADKPAVVEPVLPDPENSITVGRSAFDNDDPFDRKPFDPLSEPIGPPEPEPITPEDPALAEVPPADPTPAEANVGIALGPLDPVTPPADPSAESTENVVPTPPPAPPILRLYTIESGDSLSSIALATYGSANKWVDIAQANPLVDPNRLRVGQEIKLPDLSGEGAAPVVKAEDNEDEVPRRGAKYTVKSGDNLSKIAKQFYNSTAKWELIFQANRRTIGDDPGNLKVGMELLIPPPDTGAN
ncbi:LysM peptidoglycan-binding domain-containing protein [Algisphaera agarilytica]|uniref:Nucleoid-associated protein YgaU n=1 Tax=Algisphaera agarilytica TaxID=1385975 RepID=A0A7X0LLD8_9BACT|nr:LysM peptidoglycan-binding domain-containing protein [Algisphaera agarilytica]MBB6430907.1 nucleoid-associated protein YgaU [Algisphaera agarilytica]